MAYFDTVNWIIGTATTTTKTATTVMSPLDWVKLIIGAVIGASISSVVTIIVLIKCRFKRLFRL